jgi:hypothetical protein
MKVQLLFCIAAALLALAYGEDDENDGARLLVAKHIYNKYLVENMDVIVKVRKIIHHLSFTNHRDALFSYILKSQRFKDLKTLFKSIIYLDILNSFYT